MARHLLVVCTANVCRSPVAERMLQRTLLDRPDVDGEPWLVRSAGTAHVRAPMDRHTIAAAAAAGLDLADHVSRPLDRQILADDGADLVVVMTREHLRTVVALDPSAWPRTFTLKELARRSTATSRAAAADGGFAAWRTQVAAGRRAAAMLRPDPADDVADPYGAPLAEHVRMIAELQQALDGVVASGLWGSGAFADPPSAP